MSEELLPCPFCGNDAIFHSPDYQGNVVGCSLRHASMRSVEGWNTRVESAELAQLREKLAAEIFATDEHQWSRRPCSTCHNISIVLGRSFGCVEYRETLAIIDGKDVLKEGE